MSIRKRNTVYYHLRRLTIILHSRYIEGSRAKLLMYEGLIALQVLTIFIPIQQTEHFPWAYGYLKTVWLIMHFVARIDSLVAYLCGNLWLPQSLLLIAFALASWGCVGLLTLTNSRQTKAEFSSKTKTDLAIRRWNRLAQSFAVVFLIHSELLIVPIAACMVSVISESSEGWMIALSVMAGLLALSLCIAIKYFRSGLSRNKPLTSCMDPRLSLVGTFYCLWIIFSTTFLTHASKPLAYVINVGSCSILVTKIHYNQRPYLNSLLDKIKVLQGLIGVLVAAIIFVVDYSKQNAPDALLGIKLLLATYPLMAYIAVTLISNQEHANKLNFNPENLQSIEASIKLLLLNEDLLQQTPVKDLKRWADSAIAKFNNNSMVHVWFLQLFLLIGQPDAVRVLQSMLVGHRISTFTRLHNEKNSFDTRTWLLEQEEEAEIEKFMAQKNNLTNALENDIECCKYLHIFLAEFTSLKPRFKKLETSLSKFIHARKVCKKFYKAKISRFKNETLIEHFAAFLEATEDSDKAQTLNVFTDKSTRRDAERNRNMSFSDFSNTMLLVDMTSDLGRVFWAHNTEILGMNFNPQDQKFWDLFSNANKIEKLFTQRMFTNLEQTQYLRRRLIVAVNIGQGKISICFVRLRLLNLNDGRLALGAVLRLVPMNGIELCFVQRKLAKTLAYSTSGFDFAVERHLALSPDKFSKIVEASCANWETNSILAKSPLDSTFRYALTTAKVKLLENPNQKCLIVLLERGAQGILTKGEFRLESLTLETSNPHSFKSNKVKEISLPLDGHLSLESNELTEQDPHKYESMDKKEKGIMQSNTSTNTVTFDNIKTSITMRAQKVLRTLMISYMMSIVVSIAIVAACIFYAEMAMMKLEDNMEVMNNAVDIRNMLVEFCVDTKDLTLSSADRVRTEDEVRLSIQDSVENYNKRVIDFRDYIINSSNDVRTSTDLPQYFVFDVDRLVEYRVSLIDGLNKLPSLIEAMLKRSQISSEDTEVIEILQNSPRDLMSHTNMTIYEIYEASKRQVATARTYVSNLSTSEILAYSSVLSITTLPLLMYLHYQRKRLWGIVLATPSAEVVVMIAKLQERLNEVHQQNQEPISVPKKLRSIRFSVKHYKAEVYLYIINAFLIGIVVTFIIQQQSSVYNPTLSLLEKFPEILNEMSMRKAYLLYTLLWSKECAWPSNVFSYRVLEYDACEEFDIYTKSQVESTKEVYKQWDYFSDKDFTFTFETACNESPCQKPVFAKGLQAAVYDGYLTSTYYHSLMGTTDSKDLSSIFEEEVYILNEALTDARTLFSDEASKRLTHIYVQARLSASMFLLTLPLVYFLIIRRQALNFLEQFKSELTFLKTLPRSHLFSMRAEILKWSKKSC